MENRTDEFKKIKDWISKNGYPLEINTAKKFKKNDFHVSQSLFYKDLESGKYREIDVIAHKTFEFNNVSLNVSFVIECKKTTDKPWIVFQNTEIINTKYKEFSVFASKNGQKLMKKIKENGKRPAIFFPEEANSGYSVVTCFNEKNDLAYSASQSITNACKHLVMESDNSKKRFCNIYIPIVVIEGKLFSSYLNDNNEIDICEAKWSSVYNTVTFEEDKISWLTIVTYENLTEFIDEMSGKIDCFIKENNSEITLTLGNHPVNNQMKYNIG